MGVSPLEGGSEKFFCSCLRYSLYLCCLKMLPLLNS